MKMGVKEFRERFSEVADGGKQVVVTKNGRIIGRYEPVGGLEQQIDWDLIDRRLEAFRADFRATTPDWQARLASIGLNAEGEPYDPCD